MEILYPVIFKKTNDLCFFQKLHFGTLQKRYVNANLCKLDITDLGYIAGDQCKLDITDLGYIAGDQCKLDITDLGYTAGDQCQT